MKVGDFVQILTVGGMPTQDYGVVSEICETPSINGYEGAKYATVCRNGHTELYHKAHLKVISSVDKSVTKNS